MILVCVVLEKKETRVDLVVQAREDRCTLLVLLQREAERSMCKLHIYSNQLVNESNIPTMKRFTQASKLLINT